ncbi:MAG: hypothetical protein JJU00_00030 [Opitutales bacterium]|nr:hypothetical protein [Opitutales bacterium]
MQFYECRNIRVEGVTLRDSPMWLLHAIYSEDVEVRGATFISHGSNGDGIVIDSTRNVRISNCFFDTGDDCIVIKSGRDGEGRRIGRPSEAIAVTNCVMFRGNGAVVVGSEMSGGVRAVTASNIVTYGTKRGIRFKTARGRGGVVENLRFDNWVIHNARNEAIVLHKGYEGRGEEPFTDRTPVLRNIGISNVNVQGAREVVKMMGLAEQPIENLRIHNLHGSGHNGMTVEWVEDFELHNVHIDARPAPPPPNPFAPMLYRIALAFLILAGPVFADTRIVGLRCEYSPDPLGIDVAEPRLYWRMESDERGQRQTAWRILVASSPDRLARDEGDLWDSGRVDPLFGIDSPRHPQYHRHAARRFQRARCCARQRHVPCGAGRAFHQVHRQLRRTTAHRTPAPRIRRRIRRSRGNRRHMAHASRSHHLLQYLRRRRL